MEKVKEKTLTVLTELGIPGEVEIVEPAHSDAVYVTIHTPDARLLIGEKGQNLFALEHVIKKILQKEQAELPNFFLDINGYRTTLLEELRDEVKSIAKKVRLYRKEIRMRPMRAYERRIVHTALAEYPDITTVSEGEDPERTVIIKPYP